MFTYIKADDLINSKQFIREPVDDISRTILNTNRKKIIINSPKGTGKSVILHNMQNRGLGMDNQTILAKFDCAISLAKQPNKIFNEKLFNHYYEILFCYNLISYIKNNYSLIYEKYFKDIKLKLDKINNETLEYINNIAYLHPELEKFLSSKEITSKIIHIFKESAKVEKLNIAINNFDSINGSSSYVQQILTEYFDLFDKTIIASSDTNIDKIKLAKEYLIINPDYGKNIDVVKQIIISRIQLYNSKSENKETYFDENILTDKIYNMLIDKCDGNIYLIFRVVSEISDLLNWWNGKIDKLEDKINVEIKNQLKNMEKIKKMDANPPKLYL